MAAPEDEPDELPDGPGQLRYPIARIVPPERKTTPVTLDSDTQTERGGHYVLDGNVVIHLNDRTLQADHVEYDSNTGDAVATGHLLLIGGPNHERVSASHGTLNVGTQTGRFYDVSGSVGVPSRASGTGTAYGPPTDPTTPIVTRQAVYTNGNPFLFTGRVVVKTGPETYDVYDGTVTSCQLPKPDWLLSGTHFNLDGRQARASNTIFHLLNLPILYLPYATHPVDANDRQSGILIPELGDSTSKGLIVGEQFYLVLNRSMDLTVGAEYYSEVGWADSASFRFKGFGNDYFTGRYTQVLDRQPPGVTNIGGEDAYATGRHDFNSKARVAGTLEYLSSYIYRESFDDNFNQAVTSDVISNLYAVHESDGIETAFEGDRYQGIKVVQSPTAAGQQVHIFHAPAIMASATDHTLGGSRVAWSFEASAAGLTRTQPNFASSGIIERIDLHPRLTFPLWAGGWSLRPSVGARETFYSRSRVTPYVPGQPPVESMASLSRTDAELAFEIRPPVLERTFPLSGRLAHLLGSELRHTIEPAFTYRYVAGVGNFLNVLRFDPVDVASDTDEIEYGVTQRVYLRPRKKAACNTAKVGQRPGLNAEGASNHLDEAGDEAGATCPGEERISWRVTQKTFFDQQFGGAVVKGRRNIFSTTLDLSGVAFLTEPRETSPIVSRLRVRTSANTDLEWDADYDAGAKKFTSNNVFVDVHRGNAFGAVSYARLDAPGRFYIDGVDSSVSNFSQMRLLLGYGVPSLPGFSIAGNAGIDLDSGLTTTAATTTSAATATHESFLQYASIQSSYNWNCCGVTVEYRKYELGSVRNEGVYRFNFTLVNIGTAGNLKRSERLF